MNAKDLLNKAREANFLIGKFSVWKHSEGWSATDITTNEYFLDVEDWEYNKEHVSDSTGKNYWENIEDLLKHLDKQI